MQKLSLGLFFISIVGCSAPQKYVAPPGAPQAQVRSELDATHNYRNGLTLSEQQVRDCHARAFRRSAPIPQARQLFAVSDKSSSPAGFIAVEAGKPLHLVLHGVASGGRSCDVNFSTELTPGGHYVIKGGIVDEINKGSGCFIGIFDQDTGAKAVLKKDLTDLCGQPF